MNAPLRWPNSSLSTRFSGKAPQLTGMNGIAARWLLSWRSAAISSLPVPVSPRIMHGRIGGSDRLDQAADLLHGGRLADERGRALGGLQPRLQRRGLVRQVPPLGNAVQEDLADRPSLQGLVR